ncbi:hypothetical protein L1787_01050 [Acuticoccus sp. M5D2P5]|uniref:hypothetical protein n=1 Tax=Acuticoccus kalidii TaxID=2910977 RepID=UPI001F179B10|nr:hypothetical protein [Acuticoccus kalidii]MCF3931999.1 hypothetical protein [Acuticoccus kalidii]
MRDNSLVSELEAVMVELEKETGDPALARSMVDKARASPELDELSPHFADLDRYKIALAYVIGQAMEGRYAHGLMQVGRAGVVMSRPAVRALVRRMEAFLPEPDFDAPYVDIEGRPITFVVSFPRSGNTHLIQLLIHAVKARVCTAYYSNRSYFSNKVRTIGFRSPVFVKDHVMRPAYRNNPVIYQHRDGRDSLLSYNDFVIRGISRNRPEVVPRMADGFTRILKRLEKVDCGPWHENVDSALRHSRTHGNVDFSRYDELMGPTGFAHLKALLAKIDIDLTRSDYETALVRSAENAQRLRTEKPQWGKAPIYPDGSMMDRWLTLESGSRWRAVLSAEDKALLHSIGMTETLMNTGYETDPDWWRA